MADETNTDPKSFTQEQVNQIVADRVKKSQAELAAMAEKLKELDAIKAKLAEADAEREKAREEAELKGKSELEKLQIQLKKADEARKSLESDWGKRLAEEQSKAKAAADGLTDYVRRHLVQSALSEAGLAPKAGKAATLAFLTEAQIELSEGHEIKSIAVGGKTFDKPAEAAKHFLAENPYFAAAPAGGSNTPRPGTGGNTAAAPGSLGGLLSAGLDLPKN